MKIKAFKYTRYSGTNKEWKLVGKDDKDNEDYIYFESLNLLVSNNGGGKSRTLDVIRELSELISGQKTIDNSTYSSQIFDFIFINDDKEYNYFLEIRDRFIYQEKLIIDQKLIIDSLNKVMPESCKNIERSNKQLLVNQNINGHHISEALYIWSFFVKTFFTNQWVELNENLQELDIKDFENIDVDNPSFVIKIFGYAEKEFGKSYIDQVLSYANRLNLNFTNLEIKKGKRGYRLYVEEDGRYFVEQSRLSLRVFRALCVLIVLIYVKRKQLSACILIDDIGDGFDNDNAKQYIDIIISLSYNSSIQTFMTSTNRLVLNNIHLKNWSVLDRVDNKSIVYNIHNSASNFEDFKYTSLNNIDFFSTDFYKYGFENDDQNEEEV